MDVRPSVERDALDSVDGTTNEAGLSWTRSRARPGMSAATRLWASSVGALVWWPVVRRGMSMQELHAEGATPPTVSASVEPRPKNSPAPQHPLDESSTV